MSAINTKSATFTVGATEYASQVTSFKVTADAADQGQTTFTEAAAGGGRAYSVEIDLLQDASTVTGAGAQPLWNVLWAASGTDVVILYRPYGNTVATLAQPTFSMTATVAEPDGDLIGGDADSGTDRNITSVKWKLTGKPTKNTS